MLAKYRLYPLCLALLIGCSKDKLETRPSITLKSINGVEFTPQQAVRITFEFADNEGDLANGWFEYHRVRTNIRPIQNPGSNDKTDVDSLQIPDFPKAQRGEISLTISGEFLNEDPDVNDTMFFKIIAKDVAGNISDTISTPMIVNIPN